MKYICEHSIPNDTEKRVYTLSANDKLDYLVSVINECGISVEIISASRTKAKNGFFRKRSDRINDMCTVVSGPTFAANHGLTRVFQKAFSIIWLSFYLIANCKQGETVFVYHSVLYALPLLLVKRIKGIKIVNEVEELFFGLQGIKNGWRYRLEKKIIDESDAYIFASKQLEQQCNINNKKYAIANGSYVAALRYDVDKFNNKHFVYAGLIENGKVAFKSADIARYLPEDYTVHIIGYGNENDINEFKKYIASVNVESKCKVQFDGTKRGEDYGRYLQMFQFGLCPLSSNSEYQTSCFPSKVTSYISNGLTVITTKNEVLLSSAYKDIIVFVEDNNPENFAKTILQIDLNEIKDSRKLIVELNHELLAEIKSLLDDNCISTQ